MEVTGKFMLENNYSFGPTVDANNNPQFTLFTDFIIEMKAFLPNTINSGL